MNLRILAAAELEIIEARQHLDEKLSGLGGRLLDDLAETLSAIVEQPLRFPSSKRFLTTSRFVERAWLYSAMRLYLKY